MSGEFELYSLGDNDIRNLYHLYPHELLYLIFEDDYVGTYNFRNKYSY